MGRRRIQLRPEQQSAIERMAGLGLTQKDIAHVLGVSRSTLQRWLDDENVRWHYERGRAIAKETMAQRLWDLAMNGDTASLIFWLKAQARWSDKPEPEPEPVQNVVVYIPDNGRQ